jgi:eukaryotic-like serine/threonine-protein kinase
MEKIEGDNLHSYIKKRGRPIDGEMATRWLIELLLILQQVHNQGILHRDIKPQNIILKPDGKLALIDFGAVTEGTGTQVATEMSKSGGTKAATQTGGGTSIWTRGYAPIEQINGEAVPQSDFFGLGRTFVFLLTGKEPTDRTIYDASNDELKWQSHASGVSPHLAKTIDHMISRLARDRPINAQVILQQIEVPSSFSNQGQSV